MSEKNDDNKPRSVLDGLAKSFVGLPHSFTLSTREQGVVEQVKGNELVRAQTSTLVRQGEASQNIANRAFWEMQKMSASTEKGAQALEGTRWAAMEANGHLSRIHSALEDGLPAIAEETARAREMTEQVVGIPVKKKNIGELIGSGSGAESEAIILAIGNGLKPEQKQRLLESLPTWKRDIIESGLITIHDAEMEKTLDPRETVFLAELRRKAGSGIVSFRSIEQLARHGILEDNFHYELSKTVREVRTGLTGAVHGINELASQGDVRIDQGNRGLEFQRTQVGQGNVMIAQTSEALRRQGVQIQQGDKRIAQASESLGLQRTQVSQADVLNNLTKAGLLIGKASLDEQTGTRRGVETLVGLERFAQIERRATRIAAESTAEGIFALARGAAAQIYLAQQAGQKLDRIADSSEGIYRNTGLLAVFAERGNQIAEAHLAVGIETAEGVHHLEEIGEVSLELQESTARSSAMMANGIQNLEEIGEAGLGFMQRAELMREVMLHQDHQRNLLLADIADGIDTGNYYTALTREAIEELHLTAIQGISIATNIGMARLETAMRANDLISTLIEIHISNQAELREVLVKIEEGMERRHLSSKEEEKRFQEGLGKYQKGKVEEAITFFNKSIEHWSNDHRVYFHRGMCYVLSDRPEEAEADFKEALIWAEDTKDPRVMTVIKMNLARLYYGESKVYGETGQPELSDRKMLEAILTAKDASAGAPDFPEADFALATYLAAFGLHDEARKILMEIIPKDPSLLIKMMSVEEFGPILGDLKNTLKEDIDESNSDTFNKVSVAVIKDCIAIGEFDVAIKCMKGLIAKGATSLLRLRIWEIEELNPIRKQIVQLITESIDSIDAGVSQNCYAIAMLALAFRADPGEISDFKVFDAFIKGTENDPDVLAKNKVAMHKKLSALSKQGFSKLLGINKLHKKGLDWL